MSKDMTPTALYSGRLPIGGVELDCAVLDDGTRVLSERAVHRAFGTKGGGAHWQRIKGEGEATRLPSFLSATNLVPFIPKELQESLGTPITYKESDNGFVANGLRAELLPEVCSVYLKARRAGEILPSQMHIANQAEILMEAFAQVGIVALVDEATGYQRERTHDALRQLLSFYIEEGLRKWLKTFPDEFFEELDRLYDNERTTSRSRPQYYGGFINRYIYEPIENGYVKEELDKLNIDDDGRRKARFHQWLTDEGRSILLRQIGGVQSLMGISRDIEDFKKIIKKKKQVSVAPYLFEEMNRITD